MTKQKERSASQRSIGESGWHEQLLPDRRRFHFCSSFLVLLPKSKSKRALEDMVFGSCGLRGWTEERWYLQEKKSEGEKEGEVSFQATYPLADGEDNLKFSLPDQEK